MAGNHAEGLGPEGKPHGSAMATRIHLSVIIVLRVVCRLRVFGHSAEMAAKAQFRPLPRISAC